MFSNSTTLTTSRQIHFAAPVTGGEVKPTTARINYSTLNASGLVIGVAETAAMNLDAANVNLFGQNGTQSAIGYGAEGELTAKNQTTIKNQGTQGFFAVGNEKKGTLTLDNSTLMPPTTKQRLMR